MRYADLDNLIADYIPEAKSEKDKTAIGRVLDSVSEYVDVHCKRTPGYFGSILVPAQAEGGEPTQPAPTMQRVRGEGQHFLRLPVHVFGSITEIDGKSFAELSASIYESEKNGWLYFESEEFGNENGFASGYECRRFADGRVYKVAARWGFAETPKPVAEAVRLITARIWSTQRGTIGQLTPEGFIQERLIPTAAKDLLKPFIKREFER